MGLLDDAVAEDVQDFQVRLRNPSQGMLLGSPTIATVTVNDNDALPVITSPPQSRTNVAGTTASFSVTANGATPLTYQWRFNGTPLAGQTATNLALASVQGTNAGNYDVIVTNVAGSLTSAVATLTVWIAPSITAQPQSLTVSPGSPAGFDVSVSGTMPLCFRWYKDGAALAGYTSSSCQFAAVATGDAGSYRVVVTNLAGCTTSAVAVLTVQMVGRVMAWGDNFYGQTNVPPGLSNVVAVAAGSWHSLALGADGIVTAWGLNFFGQTDVPPGLSNVLAVTAGEYQSLALRSNRTVIAWGADTNVPAGLGNVVALSRGRACLRDGLQSGAQVGRDQHERLRPVHGSGDQPCAAVLPRAAGALKGVFGFLPRPPSRRTFLLKSQARMPIWQRRVATTSRDGACAGAGS